MEHLAIALITVSFIMLLFLGWREALIVSVTVPVIFSITLGAALLGGVTINRITLFALILALGLLVDASIVVIAKIGRANVCTPVTNAAPVCRLLLENNKTTHTNHSCAHV